MAVNAQESVDTKALLLNTAVEVFAQKGFDGTTVRDISDKAGVNISLVSYHFGGKKGIYQACFEGFHSRNIETVARILRPAESKEEFLARLRMYCEEVLSWYLTHKDLMQMIHREVDRGAPIVEDLFKDVFMQSFDIILGFIQSAKKKGILNSTLTPRLGAQILSGSLHQVGRSNCLSEKFFGRSLADPKYKEKMVDHLVLIFGSGLTSQS